MFDIDADGQISRDEWITGIYIFCHTFTVTVYLSVHTPSRSICLYLPLLDLICLYLLLLLLQLQPHPSCCVKTTQIHSRPGILNDTADWTEQEFQSIYVQCLQAQIKLVVELESKLDANLADVERGWVERDLLQLFNLVDSDGDGKLHREV